MAIDNLCPKGYYREQGRRDPARASRRIRPLGDARNGKAYRRGTRRGAFGGGISFYEGILHIRHPQPLQDPTWNYVVLGAAAFFEGISFAIALRQFKRLAGNTPFWEFVRRSKDPTTYTVLAEDGAALVGLAIASVGIALSHWLQLSALDGAASVLIGILLAGVASLLAWQSRGLMIGEGIRPETARALRDIALAQPCVRDVGRVLSMYVGPDDVLVTMDLDFDAGTETTVAAIAMVEVERRIRLRFPMIKRLFIESGSSAVHQRWTRPDAIRTPAETLATPDSTGEATNAP